METVKLTRIEAWKFLTTFTSRNSIFSLVSDTLVNVTKKCRITKEEHNLGEISKISEVSGTQVGSDYYTRWENKNERENVSDEIVKGKNSMPIQFLGKNKVVGIYSKPIYRKWQKDGIKYKEIVRTETKKVIVHFPNDNTKTTVLNYVCDRLSKGIDLQKKAFGNLDIWPIYRETFQPEMRKMYFDNLRSFTVDKVKYVII